MLTDLILAALHHLLVFALVAMLVAQAVVLRGPLERTAILRLARLDIGVGISAGLLLIVGLLRVWYGVMGADFYLHNPWFHAKLGSFVLVALLSLIPTVRFARWRRMLRSDADFVPPPEQAARLRTVLRIELAGVALIFVLAAAMARHGGF